MKTRGAVDTSDLVARLLAHPLYAAVRDEPALRLLMRTHVFCVWDFQCLLKALQRDLTCTEVPWLPTPDPAARRLVNEIVLDEESDVAPGGGHLSHFELYRHAMADARADTAPIDGFLGEIAAASATDRAGRAGRAGRADTRAGSDTDAALARALARPDLPAGVAAFTGESLRVARHAGLIELAATFTWGREDVIPEMFGRLVGSLAQRSPDAWGRFRYYLDRHIERDGDSHRPAAHALMARLCADDAASWALAERAARTALNARLALWDALLADIAALTPSAHSLPAAPHAPVAAPHSAVVATHAPVVAPHAPVAPPLHAAGA